LSFYPDIKNYPFVFGLNNQCVSSYKESEESQIKAFVNYIQLVIQEKLGPISYNSILKIDDQENLIFQLYFYL